MVGAISEFNKFSKDARDGSDTCVSYSFFLMTSRLNLRIRLGYYGRMLIFQSVYKRSKRSLNDLSAFP
jgi:hypothetical protein